MVTWLVTNAFAFFTSSNLGLAAAISRVDVRLLMISDSLHTKFEHFEMLEYSPYFLFSAAFLIHFCDIWSKRFSTNLTVSLLLLSTG